MDIRASFVTVAAVAVTVASFGLAVYADDPVAQPGDPQRWYVPAETPAQKSAVAMKEAAAALKEALHECRQAQSAAADRKACEADARAQWKQDVRYARGLLNDNAALVRR